MGVPLVTTDIGIQGLHELKDIIPIGNTAELFANEILKIIDDDKIWLTISKNGQKYVQDNFSFSSMLAFFKSELGL